MKKKVRGKKKEPSFTKLELMHNITSHMKSASMRNKINCLRDLKSGIKKNEQILETFYDL